MYKNLSFYLLKKYMNNKYIYVCICFNKKKKLRASLKACKYQHFNMFVDSIFIENFKISSIVLHY